MTRPGRKGAGLRTPRLVVDRVVDRIACFADARKPLRGGQGALPPSPVPGASPGIFPNR